MLIGEDYLAKRDDSSALVGCVLIKLVWMYIRQDRFRKDQFSRVND